MSVCSGHFGITNPVFFADLATENQEEGLEAFEDVLTIEETAGNWYESFFGLMFQGRRDGSVLGDHY